MTISVSRIQKEIQFRIHQREGGVKPPAVLPARIQKEIATLESLATWIQAQRSFDRSAKRVLSEMTAEESGRVGGQIGGRSTSAAKAKAARENGRKGGRPRVAK